MSNLLIVDSPRLVEQLSSFLGEDWKIVASSGHVRDLPDDELGIDITNLFTPQYRVLKSHGAVVNRIKRAAKAADAVYLATSPDRDGEALAWHLLELLKTETKDKPVYRVTFNAITQKALQEALAAPRSLDMNMVEAQQARRILDRLVGYLVSPLACKALQQRVSVGRGPSVCLRLVADREREIAAFAPTRKWTLDAVFSAGEREFVARLATIQGQRIALTQQSQIDHLTGGMMGKQFWINAVDQQQIFRRPLPPFSISSLQQAASKALGLSPDKTMMVAQALYDAGYITYPRTDSTGIRPDAQVEALELIAFHRGQAYIPTLPQVYPPPPQKMAEEHEAIRPTRVNCLAGELPRAEEAKLYDLIWRRFVASQMADAAYVQVCASVHCGERLGRPYPLEFEAKAWTRRFDGFLSMYEEPLDEDEIEEPETTLPPLSPQLPLTLVKWKPQERATKAPNRYTEASLVRSLEQRGLGRPATYASIVKTIQEKGYVQVSQSRVTPTQGGIALSDFLTQHFPTVFDDETIASLECDLDRIAAGKTDRLTVIQAFWNTKFSGPLQGLTTKVFPGSPRRPKVIGTCPKCGGDLVERHSAKGTFAGCINYPKCTGTARPVRFGAAKKGKVKS